MITTPDTNVNHLSAFSMDPSVKDAPNAVLYKRDISKSALGVGGDAQHLLDVELGFELRGPAFEGLVDSFAVVQAGCLASGAELREIAGPELVAREQTVDVASDDPTIGRSSPSAAPGLPSTPSGSLTTDPSI